MQSSRGIDWYAISKLNYDAFDLQIFSQIVSNAHPSHGIDRVSLHYRKKLLILFQNASLLMKRKTPDLVATNSELQVKKSIIGDNLHLMEGEVQQSFKEITNMKIILAEKKRLLGKLRQKLQRKGKNIGRKIYCCAICNRQDFTSIDLLKDHIDRQHHENLHNRSESSNQVSDLKDLLMTMKDKEIEMMSMFLKASREIQSEKLQKDYDNQYKKFMHVSGAKTDQSKQEHEPEELKGESQFLFFQKSDHFRREMERDQEFRRKVNQQKYQKPLHNTQNYQSNNYYHVFGSISENASQHIDEQRGVVKRSEEAQTRNHGSYDPNEFLSRFLQQHQNISRDSRYSLVEDTPQPFVQPKEGRVVEKYVTYAAPSISDRLKQGSNKHKGNYDTMYSTKRKFYEQNGYIFSSGPLLDDQGDGSDYEDYFGKEKTLNMSIQDEQIKIVNQSQNTSKYPVSKQSLQLSKLNSPKNHSSLLDKSLKQKSSDIVDLSDSFSKRDFELSKDETINLSDLKLSKLEKKKEEEKINKIKENEKCEVKVSLVESKQSKNIVRNNSNSNLNHQSTDILRQFQRPIVTPLREQNYKFNQQGNSINMFIKPNDRTGIINSVQKSSSKNNLGVLNEFLKEEFIHK